MSHCESCAHRLVVGDALRISATHYPYDLVGQLYVVFFHDLKVTDYIDNGSGGYDGDAVECLLGENTSAIFIIPLLPISRESRLLPI